MRSGRFCRAPIGAGLYGYVSQGLAIRFEGVPKRTCLHPRDLVSTSCLAIQVAAVVSKTGRSCLHSSIGGHPISLGRFVRCVAGWALESKAENGFGNDWDSGE